MFFLKCFFFFFTIFHHAKIKGIKELATVIELRNKNEQNVISYSQIKKIKNISCEEISNNCNLLIAHIVTITNFNCQTKNKQTQIEGRGRQIQIESRSLKIQIGAGC